MGPWQALSINIFGTCNPTSSMPETSKKTKLTPSKGSLPKEWVILDELWDELADLDLIKQLPKKLVRKVRKELCYAPGEKENDS
jgi:hypothetical protein